ncbi:unnamed protein product [Cercospora beticola]|nr:unnamed protein product [Cercospora beticola]
MCMLHNLPEMRAQVNSSRASPTRVIRYPSISCEELVRNANYLEAKGTHEISAQAAPEDVMQLKRKQLSSQDLSKLKSTKATSSELKRRSIHIQMASIVNVRLPLASRDAHVTLLRMHLHGLPCSAQISKSRYSLPA